MAEKTETTAAPNAATEQDQQRARQWFKKAEDCRERREYDYAIHSYITGLGYWPEAVEEGHMPLRALSLQRLQAGGKKPGMMDAMKKGFGGKDQKQNMLNAEELLSKEPTSAKYMDAMLKAATRGGYVLTASWLAPIVLESLKRESKPNMGRFKFFREQLVAGSEAADAQGDPATAVKLLESALHSLDYLIARNPSDMQLKDEQRNLSGRLTIMKGKYSDADDFRDSLQDAESQKLLHDAERMKQGEGTLEALIASAKEAYEAEPGTPAKINAYVDALLKPERDAEEHEARRVLQQAWEETQNYAFKARADDVRLRQLRRQARKQLQSAKESGSDEDRQQARLAAMELLQNELDVYRERVKKYPTDLKLKAKLGAALFNAQEYDEAIPVLQAAQADPRSRARSQYLMGRAFLEKGSPDEAAEILEEALEAQELKGELYTDILYWLGRSYESAGNAEKARGTYGKLLRHDYNYGDGEARQRMEALK